MSATSFPPTSAVLLGALLVLASVLAGCTSAPDGEGARAPAANHGDLQGLQHFVDALPAKDFDVTTIDGEPIRLSDYEGKVVFLEFMGAGCHACLRNLPDHKEIYSEFKDHDGFVFLALGVWSSEDEDDLRAYRDKHELEWPMAVSPRQTAQDYGVRGTPTQVFVDHEGLLHSRGGFLSQQSMRAEVTYLLDMAAQADA